MSRSRVPARALSKLQPRLRMMANGSSVVNAVRAERSATLTVSDEGLLRAISAARGTETAAVASALEELPRMPARGRLKEPPSSILANAFVHLVDSTARDARLPGEFARRGNIVEVQAPLSTVEQLATHPAVAFVELGETLRPPTPVRSEAEPLPPSFDLRRFGNPARHHFGRDVLIGIIDVGGFDFAHPDFLDAKRHTRFIRIWDQGGNARPSPAAAQFAYGAEFTADHLNAAIAASAALGLPPQDIEHQSQQVEGSHGTHVASIAAGNRGVSRQAVIAGVLISLPTADQDLRKSFYDSTRLADAVDYLLALGVELGKPVSINISLGTNGHAHDGSAAVARWIDAALAVPGRCVTVAAGNAGQEIGQTPEDLGWLMGRIHASGRIPASGLETDLEWVVVGNGVLDVSDNELELWFSPQDRVAVSVRLPSGEWIGPIEPQQFIENRQVADGSMLSIYNELYHPANGANYISIYLSPFFSDTAIVGVMAGTWTVRLHGREIRDGRYHGWIERDDPQRIGRVGAQEAWMFPSFFTERSLVDNSTVSSLGCTNRVVTVANLDGVRNRINRSSSQGPTRDGRPKPDIAAPGTDIVAAKAFSDANDRWLALTGTSMASPLVAGLAGLMLNIQPDLTSAQIEAILRRTARPLPGASFEWIDDAGFGIVNPEAALEEAAMLNERKDLT
jgi:subtilisin family serine protease